jgi:formyl-CoA transferase
LDYFSAKEITVGPINDAKMVLEDPHVIERGIIVMQEDAETNGLPMHAVPCRFSATPGALRRPSPRLDELAGAASQT